MQRYMSCITIKHLMSGRNLVYDKVMPFDNRCMSKFLVGRLCSWLAG